MILGLRLVPLLFTLMLLLIVSGILIGARNSTAIAADDIHSLLPMLSNEDESVCPNGFVWKPFDVKQWQKQQAGSGRWFTSTVDDSTMQNLTPIGLGTYRVEIDTPSQINFRLMNIGSVVMEPRFITLVNGKQINIQGKPYIDQTLSPGRETHLTLDIPPLLEGIYDVSIVFIDPPNSPITDFPYSGSYRFTIVSGSPSLNDTPRYSRLQPSRVQLGLQSSHLYFVRTTWDANPYNNILFDVIEKIAAPGEVVSLYTNETYNYDNITNTDKTPLPLMQMITTVLVDYHQVGVMRGEISDYTLYSRQHHTVTAPVQSGQYDVTVIRISNIHLPQCRVYEYRQALYGFSGETWLDRVVLTVK